MRSPFSRSPPQKIDAVNIRITSLSVDPNLLNPTLEIALDVPIKLQNPNRYDIRIDDLRVDAYKEGMKVANGAGEKFVIPSNRDTEVVVGLTLFSTAGHNLELAAAVARDCGLDLTGAVSLDLNGTLTVEAGKVLRLHVPILLEEIDAAACVVKKMKSGKLIVTLFKKNPIERWQKLRAVQ